MRSIRLSLTVYFLGLLAVALAVASVLVYQTAGQTLREKQEATGQLIQAQIDGAALVSTVPLNSKSRGGTGDTHRTLQVCRLLDRDRDPMVARALSWALRELTKRDPRGVREFLANRKDALPAPVRREVNNKLKTGVKNPKKR